MIQFDVPGTVVPVPLSGPTVDGPATFAAAVRAALPDAPDQAVEALAALGAPASVGLRRANPLYAGLVFAGTGGPRPRLTTSQIVVTTRPLRSDLPPDTDLTLHLLRREFGADSAEPLATPLGPGTVLVTDRHPADPAPWDAEPPGRPVRVVQVHVPVTRLGIVLVLTQSTTDRADVELHAEVLAVLVRSLRVADGGPPRSGESISAALDPRPGGRRC